MVCKKGYHLMAKPMGPICNLACEYCFYLEKKELFPIQETFRMSDAVLEAYISKYMEQDIPEISFVWQGGEPMLAGLGFYERAVELQKQYADGRKVNNSIQTNGVLLDAEWCLFLKLHGFNVGLSFDGPEHIHNRYRKDHQGQGTFGRVLKGLRLLQKYGIEYNVLACVSADTCSEPVETYQYFKELGVKYIQFTPVIEREMDEAAQCLKLQHAMPGTEGNHSEVTEWSVKPEAYGDYLNQVFDEWIKTDVGNIYVMNFEWTLTSWMGLENTVCIFTEQCGNCGIIEHNGDIYSCDHYMYPQYKLGNIMMEHPKKLMNAPCQREFGKMKNQRLPEECRKCEVLFACRGECPRHRFVDAQGNDGKSYLCEGYKKFFWHIHPYMKAMVQLIENKQPVSGIMTLRENPVVLIRYLE